jgi:arginase
MAFNQLTRCKFSLNNFQCALGQKKNGVQFGGGVILNNFMKRKHRDISVNINNILINTTADYQKGFDVVRDNIRTNKINVNIGGDHSISAASIQPLLDYYKQDLLVIWIDAHADLNTYDASLTKNMHGMPVGALTGLMDHWYKDTANKSNRTILDVKNLLYVGIRDLDVFEWDTITKRNIRYFPTYTSDVIQFIKAHPARHIHISCDIDSMNPHIMPSTGTPVPHGLTLKNVTNIIKTAKPRLIGFDLVEFNPLIGNKRQVRTTLNNIHRLLTKVVDS